MHGGAWAWLPRGRKGRYKGSLMALGGVGVGRVLKNFLCYIEYFLYICIFNKDCVCAGYGNASVLRIVLCVIGLWCVRAHGCRALGQLQGRRERLLAVAKSLRSVIL